MISSLSDWPAEQRPSVFLFGAGVVGRAIVQAHVDAGVSIVLIDQNGSVAQDALAAVKLPDQGWQRSAETPLEIGSAFVLASPADRSSHRETLVIESISEQLAAKRSFYAAAERFFDVPTRFCTNTSTLRICDIAASLSLPDQLCGMHFFMPVDQRPAVEVVRGPRSSPDTIGMAVDHARRINKQPLIVGDGPGFVVNRVLSPYLNQAMRLLERGISADRIERAAIDFGMPMSPLELIDWIGTRTVFDAGRVFWQAFPNRIEPSPIAPALLKRKRLGRADGAGFYDYCDGQRSQQFAPEVQQIVNTYRRDPQSLDQSQITALLAIPMWIEAALACRERIVESPQQLEIAMKGGLGFLADRSWLGFFDSLGSQVICSAAERWPWSKPATQLPPWLAGLLARHSPSEALMRSNG